MNAARLQSGLSFAATGLAVRGVVCAVPPRVVDNAHFHAHFEPGAVADVVKMIGVQTRRWSAPEQTTADLCEAAARTLLDKLAWDKDSVDAVIFISQTPDYRLPATACALHGRLGLPKACVAFDVNLGCSGYVYGLWLASRLLDGVAIKRVLLLVGDTISKTVDPSDRATALLFGDAGSATALEYEAGAASHFITGTDGAGAPHLLIPEGGYRALDTSDARLADRAADSLYMDGGEIFNFTLSSIPTLVKDLFALAGRETADAYLFHQANTFMLKHIIKKAKIAPERAPINMDRFGNTSSASIPLLIVDQLAELRERPMDVAMFGFGVGYSWAAGLLSIGPLAVCELIEA